MATSGIDDDDESVAMTDEVDIVPANCWEQLAAVGTRRGLSRVTEADENGNRKVVYSTTMGRHGESGVEEIVEDSVPARETRFTLFFDMHVQHYIQTVMVTLNNPSVWTLLIGMFGNFRKVVTLNEFKTDDVSTILCEILRVSMVCFLKNPPNHRSEIRHDMLERLGPTRFGQLHMLMDDAETILNGSECTLEATSLVVRVTRPPEELRDIMDMLKNALESM